MGKRKPYAPKFKVAEIKGIRFLREPEGPKYEWGYALCPAKYYHVIDDCDLIDMKGGQLREPAYLEVMNHGFINDVVRSLMERMRGESE